MKRFVLTLVLLTSSGIAFAHTHLKSTVPQDGSTLQSAPKTITLKFEGEVQVTALSVIGADGKEQKVAKLPEEKTATPVIALPALNAGAYTVKWRAAGHDGHVISGQLKFSVDAK